MTKECECMCGICIHFVDDPDELESMLPGLTSLSSARGDTRGDQGICVVHQRFLHPAFTCPSFEPRGGPCPEGVGAWPGRY